MHTTILDSQLAYPHYSNPIWREPRLIYLKKGVDSKAEFQRVDYSDRLEQWDSEADKRGKAAKTNGTSYRSAMNVHLYLEAYYQQKVDLFAIAGGVNLSSGYEYYVYYYNLLKG